MHFRIQALVRFVRNRRAAVVGLGIDQREQDTIRCNRPIPSGREREMHNVLPHLFDVQRDQVLVYTVRPPIM